MIQSSNICLVRLFTDFQNLFFQCFMPGGLYHDINYCLSRHQLLFSAQGFPLSTESVFTAKTWNIFLSWKFLPVTVYNYILVDLCFFPVSYKNLRFRWYWGSIRYIMYKARGGFDGLGFKQYSLCMIQYSSIPYVWWKWYQTCF